ncbi:MAG TPA: efflux RND transporter periplasmic adaptor subunit [Thermoguttaceae bacterium]|nr:efflux RND transporter periplasmic adaptor subunit [Thermoguttaceae bacterium]
MGIKDSRKLLARWASGLAVLMAFAVGVILLLIWLAGGFSPKVPMQVESPPGRPFPPDASLATACQIQVPRFESSVGTIRAVHEASIGSKLLARVLEIDVKAGQEVHAGDVLVRLDDADIQAKLQQAKAAVMAAEAAHEQSATDEQRYAELVKTGAVSRQDYDNAVTKLRSDEARLRSAHEAVKEAQATLDYATVRAPMDAVVIDKKVDVGDLITPGQILVTLFDPKRMQLIASVRESLASDLQVGQAIDVQVERLHKRCQGTVAEIVPEAQTASRTFQVKVTGPCPTGVYTGMFGRIFIPLGEERVLVIPQQSVRHVGQLDLVDVVQDKHLMMRSIRTGRTFGQDVEVLSGLRPGEQVVVPGATQPSQEATHD